MCFKSPKPPAPTAEQIEADRIAKEQRDAAREQATAERTSEKEARTRDQQMRLGGIGMRTLLTGSRGGAGFSRGLLG